MTAPYRATSLASLKRIPLGTRLRLVIRGGVPCSMVRTVAKVQSTAIAFTCEEGGALSWLDLPSASALRWDDRGFGIVGRVAPDGSETMALRYEYMDGAS